jgi:hypothetical protein
MQFQIAFDQTGDTIPFTSLNDQILEFYVDHLTVQNFNSFEISSPQMAVNMSEKILNLDQAIKKNNSWMQILLDQTIESRSDLEYLDQRTLNQYHADWVKSQHILYDIDAKRHQHGNTDLIKKIHDLFSDDIRFPTIGTVLMHLGYAELYNKINIGIHDIENLFHDVKYKVKNQNWVEANNIFLHQGLSHSHANFKLSFHHLGRTLYDAFIAQDYILEHDDENNYNQLLGFVELSLRPPESIAMSPEYIKWCESRNRVPLGQYLNLGNILDLDKHLTDYKIVIYRNILKNNSFSIQLT